MNYNVNEGVVFVSTGGFSNYTAAETSLDFEKINIVDIELSGGKYSHDLISRLEKLSEDINFRVHNYFPPPEVPFVFNLASDNEDITFLSMEHVKKSLKLANLLGSSVYSFHAGFLMDPRVDELGKKIDRKKLSNRNFALERFISRVKILSDEALKTDSKLLIENNVLSSFNLVSFGENPLLLASPDEIKLVMGEMPQNVSLLLDVAHLKVSANSLGFCEKNAHRELLPYINAYHLSDNDGTEDSNMPFDKNSWFWADMKKNLNYYSVEVYGQSVKKLKSQQLLVQNMLMK
jgi:sugar phosphate isomerase/epimerase